MADQRDLERRVAELEAEVRQLRAAPRARWRGVRYRSELALGNLPFLSIATGPDPDKGEIRGHAKGVIAIGDMATGLVAVGGLARGGITIGGLSLGLVSLGGCAVGLLGAAGGLAIGILAFGGGAVGAVAVGGGAVGHYACGGGVFGTHVIGPGRTDPAAEAFFRQYGLDRMCQGQRRRCEGALLRPRRVVVGRRRLRFHRDHRPILRGEGFQSLEPEGLEGDRGVEAPAPGPRRGGWCRR